VDTFLYRNHKGRLIGILYRYRTDSVWEKAGNVNIWIRPDRQRRGIGTKLFAAMVKRFGFPNPEQQRYTQAGAEFAYRMIQRYQP
jgi:GNAT superfamily N-acetyltransferase